MVSISVVLPAFNEAAIIAKTVESACAVAQSITPDYEIIVVDDGSTDDTRKAVETLAESNPRVRCASHSVNRGYGSAVATGFSNARMELVFLTDGDKQFDLEELREFVRVMEADPRVDMVIGYRKPRADPLLRRLNGWGWNLLVRLLFGPTARDVDCAFKLFRRKIWENVKVYSGGATFSAEFLIKARRAGYRIVERRVTHLPRLSGKATGARLHVILRGLKDLLRLRWNLARELRERQAIDRPTGTQTGPAG